MTQGSNPGHWHCRQILYRLSYLQGPTWSGLFPLVISSSISVHWLDPSLTHFPKWISCCFSSKLYFPCSRATVLTVLPEALIPQMSASLCSPDTLLTKPILLLTFLNLQPTLSPLLSIPPIELYFFSPYLLSLLNYLIIKPCT